MHPAFSLIIFTSFTGVGLGLFTLIGFGLKPDAMWGEYRWLLLYGLAYSFTCIGLVASTFHLGNPKNAWRALSCWRSSWLSREGVLSIVTLALFALPAWHHIFPPAHENSSLNLLLNILGKSGAICALATIVCTAMIYAQLKTVPRWNMPILTSCLFLSLGLTGGLLMAGYELPSAIALVVSLCLQALYWVRGDTRFALSGHTPESATGLKGKVRLFERPHTGPNYLTREMGVKVSKQQATKLRVLSLLLAYIAPLLLILLVPPVYFWLGFLCHIAGILVSRWLFYAQAEHVVNLYYGFRPG